MCGWPSTSESAQELLSSLRAQPLLAVLRPKQPLEALPAVQGLRSIGVRHVEIAWSECADWPAQCAEIQRCCPDMRLGAASVCTAAALDGVAAAGLRYAVSPVLDAGLLDWAKALGVALIPGVMTPSEVHHARQLGCAAVKLYPAAGLGPRYWRSLAGPLGPLPFCIAAGGIHPSTAIAWLTAGVDAVAIGAHLFDASAEPSSPNAVLAALVDQLTLTR